MKKIAFLKTINSSSINAMDYNPPDDSYEYIAGKIGKAVKLNVSLPIRYDSFNKVFPREGTIEFWIQPEWDGDDGLNHTIMSIGNTFFLSKYSRLTTNGIVELNVGKIKSSIEDKSLPLTIKHDPIKEPPINRAHTILEGIGKVNRAKIKMKLSNIARWAPNMMPAKE